MSHREELTHRRAVRLLAFQMLFQLDARQGEDDDAIRESLRMAAHDPRGHFDGPWGVSTSSDPADHEAAFIRARAAWEIREEADTLASGLAPDWPAHRQPVTDRTIIRLCWYEMTQGGTPPKVAVNEAIELAKKFGTERSAPFLNGVLDRMLRVVLKDEPAAEGATETIDPADAADAAPDAADPLPLDSTEPEHTEFWSSGH